jgi:modulator of FtsH protease HflC
VKSKVSIIILAIIGIVIFSAAYVVDETEQVVVTQFGRAVGDAKTAPGLYFKIPMIQHANYFPKNLQAWDGEPGQVPTLDKTFIVVDAFARWKIVDPLKFFQTVNNMAGAMGRLDDIIDSSVRNFVTSYPLIETVRMTNRELDITEVGVDLVKDTSPLGEVTFGRSNITKGVLEQARPKLLEFGIDLVDVKFKLLNYVEEVEKTVYARMIAERKQIAEKFRSEGKGEARKIEGDMEKDLKEIESGAYRRAQEIKGKSDAEATLIYARSLGKDPEFYSFLQTLDIYKETMDKTTSLVLSTDSELLRFFKGYEVKQEGKKFVAGVD